MQTAKIFKNGSSQAIRLPKDFRFSGTDVYIKKFENVVMLIPKDDPWASFVDSLDDFTDDFMDERNQPTEQVRQSFD
jgi:antitoxin VapB